MFYSTDLLLKRNARFALIWRLATTNGKCGKLKKSVILSTNIRSVVEEILQRVPSSPLTSEQQRKCLSLRLISHLLYGTCVVLQIQAQSLHADAKHVWDSCKHIRFDEKQQRTKKRKDELWLDDMDWDAFHCDEPKRKRRRSGFDSDISDLHGSQFIMGMDFLDRALMTSRSAYEIANITLSEDALPINGGGMNDPMFIQPHMDLEPTTEAMMELFLNGGEDTTFTTKESSENRSGENLRNISSPFEPVLGNKRREDRAGSEVERHRRASSYASHLSADAKGGQSMGESLVDHALIMEGIQDGETSGKVDPNASSSVLGIEEITRTSLPPNFISSGPVAISTQVDPAREPILPSEPSQILPPPPADQAIEGELFPHDVSSTVIRDESMQADLMAGEADVKTNSLDLLADVQTGELAMEERDEGEGRRKRRDERPGEESPVAPKGKAESGGVQRIITTPVSKRSRKDEEKEEERECSIRRVREERPTKLSAEQMREQMQQENWADTVVGKHARRVKIDDGKRKKRLTAAQLLSMMPFMMEKVLDRNRFLSDLYRRLNISRIWLREDDDMDDLLAEEDVGMIPWREICAAEAKRMRMEALEEEEEEDDGEAERRRRRRIEQRAAAMAEVIQNELLMKDAEMAMPPEEKIDETMREESRIELLVEHISVATIEGDWAERLQLVDVMMERKRVDRLMGEEERRRLREERAEDNEEEEEEEQLEMARRRRTTGNFSDGLRMGDPVMDLTDQPFNEVMMMEESARSEMMREEEYEQHRMPSMNEAGKGRLVEMLDKSERRKESWAKVGKDKRSTMAAVENHEAVAIIIRSCEQSETKQTFLADCFPKAPNKATVARMFYNLLVLVKAGKLVAEQEQSYGPIKVGMCPPCQFPIYD